MEQFLLAAYPTIDALPISAAKLFDAGGGLFASRAWFETFVGTGLQASAEPLFLVLSDKAGTARAMLPCQRFAKGGGAGNPSVASLTSFYSCDFRPLIAPEADSSATAFALGAAVVNHLAGEAAIRLDSLDSTLSTLAPFLAGLARPGRALLRYQHFGRWWESVEGLTFDAYLSQRDGALREVIRRKGRRLERAGATYDIIEGADVEQGICEYNAVYAKSWKEPEPFSGFQPMLLRALGKAGWLRLGVCRLDGQPIAVQLWAVTPSRATVLKLAHDKRFDQFSPGSVLTAFIIRTLMAREPVRMLDFGRGDDAYKRAWAHRRTPHIGVLSVSLMRRPGLIARHWLAGMLRGNRAEPEAET